MSLSSIANAAGSFLNGSNGIGSLLGSGGLVSTGFEAVNGLVQSATGIDLGLGSDFESDADSAWNQFSTEMRNGEITGSYSSEGVDEDGNAITTTTNVKYSFESSNSVKNATYSKRASQLPNVFGMPFTFIPTADPDGRVFADTILKDLPIITLIPGRPRFNGGMKGLADLLSGMSNSGSSGIIGFLQKVGIGASFGDKRYYTFESNYYDYYKYVNTFLSTLHMRMGLADKFNPKTDEISGVSKSVTNVASAALSADNKIINSIESVVKGVGVNMDKEISIYEFSSDAGSVSGNIPAQEMTLSYFIQNLSGNAVQESISSQYTSPTIAGQASDISSQVKEMQYLTGAGSQNDGIISAITNGIRNMRISKSVSKLLQGTMGDFVNADPALLQQIKQTQKGVELCFPEIWSNSSYSKNLTFNFKFFSPYGDPTSIFKYVYVPFISLLCFALPKQGATQGYIAPFLVRADIPGLATIEMGAVTNFDFLKGGSENLWTHEGYPRCIEGSMTISDLYPYLMMTKAINVLKSNPGFTLFIDNMAGIGIHLNKFNLNMDTWFNSITQRLAATDDYVNNFLSDEASKLQGIANAGGPLQMGSKLINTMRGLFT